MANVTVISLFPLMDKYLKEVILLWRANKYLFFIISNGSLTFGNNWWQINLIRWRKLISIHCFFMANVFSVSVLLSHGIKLIIWLKNINHSGENQRRGGLKYFFQPLVFSCWQMTFLHRDVLVTLKLSQASYLLWFCSYNKVLFSFTFTAST